MQILARYNNRTLVLTVEDADDPFTWIQHYASVHYHATVSHWSPPFCNFHSSARIRGGKGGFGTLLKGQSRQASANTTKDFGACRDLQGRRLRTVNHAVGAALHQEWTQRIQNGTATPADMAQALIHTPSGIAGWHVATLPAWSEVNPKKERRRNQILLEQWKREQAAVKTDKEEKQEQRAQAVAAIATRAQVETDAAEDRVKAALEQSNKRLKQSHPTDDDDTTLQPPAALVTLTGDVVVNRTPTAWRLVSAANFCTMGLVLQQNAATMTSIYYELVVPADICQLGWANPLLFRPNSESGDGVGDDAYSWAVDGSRGLQLHNEITSESKSIQWTEGDVVGCMWDRAGAGTMQVTVNGKSVAVLPLPPSDNATLLCPAVSWNAGTAIEVRLYRKDMKHIPEEATAVGSVLSFGSEAFVARASPAGNSNVVPEDVAPSTDSKMDNIQPNFRLDDFDSIDELQALGMDQLKAALQGFGLKCGGTLEERAKRLLAVKGLAVQEFPQRLVAKKKKMKR